MRNRFIRYLVVGAGNTLVGLLAIYVFMWLHMGNVISNMLGYGIGILLGFQLNKRWTFEHQGAYLPSFLRFLTVLGCAYLANLATVMGIISILGINSYIAQALGIIPYTIIGYYGSKHFAFVKPEGGTE